jgi:hypothetical protein
MTELEERSITKEKEPKFIGYLDEDKRIRIYRTEHQIWKAHQQIKKLRREFELPEVIGRWHYYYKNDRDQKISLVNTIRGLPGRGSKRVKREITVPEFLEGIPGYYYQSFYWEICSGGTCEGCMDADELFSTRKEAEVRILELLK